jgi:GINS complex subunit 2
MIALNQFIAEKEPMTILPNFRMQKLELIACEVGPFLPQSPCTVPLWLALFLRKQSRCRIIIPDWLSENALSELVKKEKESESYQKVHDRYLEIASLLLQYAADDFHDANKIRSLVEDVEHLRREKVRQGLEKTLKSRMALLNLTDLSGMELSEIKPFVLQSMRTLDKLSGALETEAPYQQHQTRTTMTSLGTIKKGNRKLTKYS